MKTYKNHPASKFLPMLAGEKLADLAKDIKENGLREPITLFEGEVLDGRNRLAACEKAGVKPRFETFNNGSPVLYVLSKNLHRRHLTDDQIAAVTADSTSLLRAEAKKRQATSGPGIYGGKPLPMDSSGAVSPNRTKVARGDLRAIAANQAGISTWKVQGALNVKKENPELHEKVKRGEVSLAEAKRRLTGAAKTKRTDQLENAAKSRMIAGLSHIKGICRGLKGLDVQRLAGACSRKELKTWEKISFEAAKDLRALGSKLSKEVETRKEDIIRKPEEN